MDRLFNRLRLEDSDDEFSDGDDLESLGEEELELINLIKKMIQKRKYKRIPLFFTTGKKAAAYMGMLPKVSMHLYNEVCKKNMTGDIYKENFKLYECADELLKLIASYAPVVDFLFEMLLLLSPETPECLFVSALNAMESPLLRVPEDDKIAIDVYTDCFDEIALRRDVYAPMPKYLLLGNCAEVNARLETDDDLQYVVNFHAKVKQFYSPLVKEICSHPRPETDIFRSCKTNKLNILCCFLIKMLEKPLALFDLRFIETKNRYRGPLFYAISLTQAITKCIGDPFFLLTFVEQCVRWGSDVSFDAEDVEDGNYFLKEFRVHTECLAIYYYMVIAEGVDSSRVPSVYHPLYVCETGLHLVHYILTALPAPALQDKALKLANMLLTKLRHIKIPSSDLELFIYRTFLSDLRKLALNPLTANILLQTVNVLKQFILCFVDDDRYFMLKTLMATVNHSSFCGYLINVYKDLAAEALKASSTTPLHHIYSGQQLRAIFLENICKLQQGVKTDPAEKNDQIEAALETLLLFATVDTENRTGFWSFTNEIHSQFISPLRKSLNFYESRFKTELLNAIQGRGLPEKRVRGGKANQMDRSKSIEMLKNSLTGIAKLRRKMPMVCDSLANSPLENRNN